MDKLSKVDFLCGMNVVDMANDEVGHWSFKFAGRDVAKRISDWMREAKKERYLCLWNTSVMIYHIKRCTVFKLGLSNWVYIAGESDEDVWNAVELINKKSG